MRPRVRSGAGPQRQVQARNRSDGGSGSEAYPEKPSGYPNRNHAINSTPAKPPCGGSGGRLHLREPKASGSHAQRGDRWRVSRVLSRGVIPLGWMSPSTSSDLPAGSVGSTLAACAVRRPIWSCSLGGLPCPSCCQSGGGLLPHRFTLACDPRIHRRSVLCCTVRRVAPPWCYQAQHPVEPGLSSALASSDALIHRIEASTV